MRVILAPDKFKGSLSAAEVAAALREGLLAAAPDTEVVQVPMADGGEGTVEAALAAGYEPLAVTVTGPTGLPVESVLALRGDEAVVEMAAASGLDLLPGGVKDPLGATSRGTGELVRAALDAGAQHVVLGVGGSASTDGGAGLLSALGAKVLDEAGSVLPDGGGALRRVAAVDLSGLDPRLGAVRFTLAADVDHPLTGERGAAAVFGPQKGATPEQVVALDAGLTRWATAVAGAMGPRASQAYAAPGAGAAGGVGFAALTVLGARRRPGVAVVGELVGLPALVANADLVVTGEGSFDEQSLGGKTPTGVASVARRAGVPVVAVCGRTTLDPEQWRAAGFDAVRALSALEPNPEVSMKRAGELVRELGERIGREVAAQRDIKEDA